MRPPGERQCDEAERRTRLLERRREIGEPTRDYASEAARTALAYIFERHVLPRDRAHRRAAPSIRANAHLGMTDEGDMDFYGQPTGTPRSPGGRRPSPPDG